MNDVSIIDLLLVAALCAATVGCSVLHTMLRATRRDRDLARIEYLDLKVSMSRMCHTRSECIHLSRTTPPDPGASFDEPPRKRRKP